MKNPEEQEFKPAIISQVIAIAIFLSISMLAGVIGAVSTAKSVGGWYQDLQKPSFNPPDYIFGPVWTALYFMMGVAAWLVWRQNGFRKTRGTLLIFLLQLILNSTWSYLFFGIQRPDMAFFEIIILWLAITLTAVVFWPYSRLGSLLLLPYLSWVSFAAVLNFYIWRLN